MTVSTHSRPKAAGNYTVVSNKVYDKFQHTAARRRLDVHILELHSNCLFQHTAARRRLAPPYLTGGGRDLSFNTQPPEGGWGHMLL